MNGFRFEGVDTAQPAPQVLEAIQNADAVVFCPSNPWVSIDPVLAVKGLRPAIALKTVVAVSPIIGGQTVKGPAAKMFTELGIQPSAMSVARHYGDLLTGYVVDIIDADLASDIMIPCNITQTLMKNRDDRRHLAQDVLNFIQTLDSHEN